MGLARTTRATPVLKRGPAYFIRAAAAALVAATVLAACDFEAPAPPEPREAFPSPSGQAKRTPDEVARGILSQLAPLNPYILELPPEIRIGDGLESVMLERIAAAKTAHSQTAEGQKALEKVNRALLDRLKPFREARRAHLVLLLCRMIEIIDPENKQIERYVEWAETARNRPLVSIQGWAQDLDAPGEPIYAFLKLYLPETDEVVHERRREGETFHGLRFVEIIGRNSGILFEYMPTNERFTVEYSK